MFIKPFSEDELRGNYLAEGEAECLVKEVRIYMPQGQTDSALIIKCQVWDCNGKEGEITDFIYLTDKWRWKLGNLFKACGKQLYLKEGLHSEDLKDILIDAQFKCLLGMGRPNKEGKSYIGIKQYFEHIEEKEPATNDLPFDDDIPL